MNVTPISNPLPDEHIVDVYPELKPDGIDTWLRRLNLFTGRSLSDRALSAEQAGRAGRLALLGQTLSPGVVTGLEVGLEPEDDPNRVRLQIAPGSGISASGEDVVLPTSQRVRVRDLPVFAPVSILDGATDEDSAISDSTDLLPRRLGDALGNLSEDIVNRLPRVSILVLQPIVAELIGEFDPEDPCEQDPQNDAFADWQRVDGCRLVLYSWATEWRDLPDEAEDPQTWRNRIAYTVFAAEQALDQGQILPWEAVGVPIALVGFAADRRTPLFVDGYAVVRAGGKSIRRSAWLANAGNPFLWQSRVQQFAEQLAELDLTTIAVREAAQQFRFLPPVGVLTKNAVTINLEAPPINQFFPADYAMQMAPVPLEQLDVVMQSSAALSPFDRQVPDQVQILVPVPEVFYEPRLLQLEEISDEFEDTLEAFVTRRGKWLRRRQDVRSIAVAVIRVIKGEPPTFPDPDADALEEETVADDPIDSSIPELAEPEDRYGTTLEGSQRTVDAVEELRSRLRNETPLIRETAVTVGQLPSAITFPEVVANKIRYDDPSDRLIFTGAMTEDERDELLAVPQLSNFQQAIQQLYTQSQRDELSKLEKLGLEKFIEFLEDTTQRADDTIDLGFVRVQTDIYRLRQLMLGNLAASRLATSPALAAIAKGENAAATREDIQKFLETVKGKTVDTSINVPTPTPERISRVGVRSAVEPSAGTGPMQPLARNVFVSGELVREQPRFTGRTTGPTPISGSIGLTQVVGIEPIQPGLERVIGGRPIVAKEVELDLEISQAQRKVTQVQADSTAQLFKTAIETPKAIVEDAVIVGKAYNFRTTTVDERLSKSEALEAKSFTVASKYSVVADAINLDLAVDDLELPGFGRDDNGNEIRRTVRTIREENLANRVLNGEFDPDLPNGDEAAFFAVGVKATENSVAMLRILEGRIKAYRQAIELCRKTLATLNQTLTQIDQRLKVIGDELAEARHDVAVTRALLAEELARIGAINQRRQQILNEHVPFLVYHRPRAIDLRRSVPVRTIEPGLMEAPVPACLSRDEAIPAEIQEAADLLRDAPIRWFTHLSPLLTKLDKPEILIGTLEAAKRLAQIPRPIQPALQQLLVNPGLLPQAIQRTIVAQQQIVQQYRLQTAQLNVSSFIGQSWLQVRERAIDLLSLGDLIDHRHQRLQVAQQAVRELEQITHVAACLYTNFSQVLPAIRLNWAERLSQYDEPINLRDLASLPRWGEIASLERREMQALADWLYQRIDARQTDAIGLISDLIRICILLASHAPVNQIISGRVVQPTTVQPGNRVKLTIDPANVCIGMQVKLYASNNQVVAQAIVEDLTSNQASARITQAFQPNVQLLAESRVEFVLSDRFVGRGR